MQGENGQIGLVTWVAEMVRALKREEQKKAVIADESGM